MARAQLVAQDVGNSLVAVGCRATIQELWLGCAAAKLAEYLFAESGVAAQPVFGLARGFRLPVFFECLQAFGNDQLAALEPSAGALHGQDARPLSVRPRLEDG